MDNKQTPDDKIAAEELLNDAQLDNVTGGGQLGTGCFSVDNSLLLKTDPTNEVKHFEQLDMSHGKTGPG